jgi:hypothetical protein
MGIYGTDALGLMNNLSEAYQVGEMIPQSKPQKPQPEAMKKWKLNGMSHL